MKRYTVHLSPQQIIKLKELYKETGITIAEHIRRAIDTYLSKKR